MTTNLTTLSEKKLNELLAACTIGGNNSGLIYSPEEIMQEYITRSMHGVEIKNLKKINSKASLNSISATAEIKYKEIDSEVFVKIHIESDTNNTAALGLENEYSNFLMLDNAGWPMLKPLYASLENEYKLLVYPRVYDPTLFELLYESYRSGSSKISEEDISVLESMNAEIGKSTVRNINLITPQEFNDSPVNNLFLKRVEENGRVGKWYNRDTKFKLNGISDEISWDGIKNLKWKVNGIELKFSLDEMISFSRENLHANNNSELLYGATSHGDDHAGNIFISKDSAYLFDPAFAGINPIILSDIKAFAHISILPLFGMYYDSGVNTTYSIKDGYMEGTTNAHEHFMQATNYKLGTQIVDTRIIPSVKYLLSKGGELENILNTIKSALFCCGFLTINASMNESKLMASNNGLLAVSMLMSELAYLPQLEYLKNKIEKI